MTKTTRRQGSFSLDMTSPEALEASITALADELSRIEATCNRCAGNGTSWWQRGMGTCHRCHGTGSAEKIAHKVLAEADDARRQVVSPYAVFNRWVRDNWLAEGNAAAHGHLVHCAIKLAEYAFVPGPTLTALFVAVVEGRQRGPIRVETAERINAEESYSGRKARSAA